MSNIFTCAPYMEKVILNKTKIKNIFSNITKKIEYARDYDVAEGIDEYIKELESLLELTYLNKGVDNLVFECKNRVVFKFLMNAEHFQDELNSVRMLIQLQDKLSSTSKQYILFPKSYEFDYNNFFLIVSYEKCNQIPELERLSESDETEFMKLFEIVKVLHSYGIYHNDIHKNNILYKKGIFLLIDFGFFSNNKCTETYCDNCLNLNITYREIFQKYSENDIILKFMQREFNSIHSD